MKRCKAPLFSKLCTLLALVGQTSGHAQSIHSYQSINIAMQAIRQAHGVLTGLEIPAADEANKNPITFDPSGRDIARVFDSVVARRPVYSWSLKDGVYDVYPKQQGKSLSQLNVAAFVLTDSTLDEAQAALFNLPEVKEWLTAHHAARGGGGAEHSGLGPGPAGPFPQPKRVSLTVTNVRLYTILNQLISKFGRTQWIIGHAPVEGQYDEYVSIEP